MLFFFFLLLIKTGESVFLCWELFNLGSSVGEFNLIFDWVSLSFGCVVLFISANVFFFSCEYIKDDVFLSRFRWLVFLFVLSISFVIFIPNLISILLGWDGLGLVSFLLVIYYQNYKSLRGGIITVLINRVGDVIILLSVGLLCKEGVWHFFYISSDFSLSFVVAFILLAGITKRAQIPFSSWLPAAIAAPTPVSALVHSSTLVTAGVFLLIRFFPFLKSFWWFQWSLLLISVITILMAGIAANIETDLKKVIALSTLSQLGVIISALGLGSWKLALFHLYTHAMFKALLFLCAGAFIHRFQHGQDLRLSGLVWNRLPEIVSCFHVANLALCGAPFLAGFYSKDLILEFSLYRETNFFILFIIFFATGITVMYSLRLSYFVLWRRGIFYRISNMAKERVYEAFPIFLLTLGGVIGGSFLMWGLFWDEGVIYLNLFEKLVTFVCVVMGGFFGWLISSYNLSLIRNNFFSHKWYFGSCYIWFLSNTRRQGIIKDRLKIRSSLLYYGDRGWLEVFGGEGVYLFSNKFVVYVQKFSFNTLLVYLRFILFFIFFVICWFVF